LDVAGGRDCDEQERRCDRNLGRDTDRHDTPADNLVNDHNDHNPFYYVDVNDYDYDSDYNYDSDYYYDSDQLFVHALRVTVGAQYEQWFIGDQSPDPRGGSWSNRPR
jgi:hypothetical protein